MSPGRRRPARTSTVAPPNALVWRRALPAPGFAVTVAAGFLIAETVLVVLLKQVEPEDPVGIVYAVLMGVALVGNFVAGVAAAASASADRRREAELSSDLAHMVLRTGDLPSAANEAGRHLAAAFDLRFASVELTKTAGDHRPGAIPLHEDDVLFGVLEVPDDLPRTTLERLLRVVPTLEALLAAARDREKVNNRLIESRHRLQQFFDLTSDLMVISDQGKLLEVNPAFEKALGYTVDGLAPTPFELVPPEDMDRLREPIKDLTDGRGPVRFENRATTCDGSSRWIEWSVAPHQGLFYAVGRDVTGQREEEEQLRETRTMLEASRDTLRELAEHQAGLRRVATLVARGANPVEVFDAVYDEMARCMHVTDARLSRYDDDKTATILTARREPGMQNLSGGTRLTLADDELLSKVLSTGQPARQGAAIGTALGVPVIVDGRVWGGLSAGSAEREPLSSDSEARIADFADLVATAIANTAAREQLDASRERLRASRDRLRQLARHQTALRRVAELVAREAEPAEVFNAVAEEMANILDVYNATVGRFDGDDIVMAAIGRPEVDIPNPPTVGERFPLDGDHVAATVRRTGRPARIDSHEHAAGVSAARIRKMGIASMVGVPIMVGAELWGVAAVASRGEPLPADTEVGIADFADLVATAIANAAAREQLNASRDSLRQLARQQTALRRVAELVAREAEPAAVFNAVAEEMASCLDAYNATVIRHEGDFLVIEALASFNQDLPNPPVVGQRLPLEGDHVAPMIVRTGRPARMDSHEHAAGETAALIRALGIQSMVGVPIVVGGQLWGSAAVGSRTGPLPPDTEARMADFADLVATSIANAATRAELQAGRDSLRELAESLSVLARQQAALRRVATLVARGVSQSEVFSAVAEEMAGCLNVGNAEVLRFEDDGAATVVVASYAEPGVPHLSLGERLSTEGDNVAATVSRTRQSARMDNWEGAAGPIAQRVRELGVRSRIGAPIVVDERLWGIAVVATTAPDPLPPDTESRIVEFAELVATAIAAATTRAELIASRARIVAAADDARRRLERDIHDGAQQRLVSLGLKLRLTEESVPCERDDLKSMLSEAVSGLTDVFQELQELSRGIHPAILSTGGLRAAFKTLARRSSVPVKLDVAIPQRLPDSIEVAAYYVVAEALTNAAKHAQASEVRIRARTTGAGLDLLISDDGIGGADSGRGSGLIGLKDRIEVLGGRMQVESPPGVGTALDITIPYQTNTE
ncbi:GAF domain-containing protein [Mycobacterium sp.]|uniref:GAF domain-containing protein n=2 Tax=Mycobacterium sp. TaxID=1785 RepID=UPI003F963CAA